MLPIETKQAMLVGLDNETIVTGAYSHDGGVCPMLAAHRRGGLTATHFAILILRPEGIFEARIPASPSPRG